MLSIHYNKTNDEFIINKQNSIVNTLCIANDTRLYKELNTYYLNTDNEINHLICSIILYKLTNITEISIYSRKYPNTVRHIITDENVNDLQEDIKKVIIHMYRFNRLYQTSLYNESIKILKSKLNKYDLQLLNLKLERL